MKFMLKLLKDYKGPDGTEFKAGEVIEIDDKALAAELILDGVAEKTDAVKVKKDTDSIHKSIEESVAQAVADAIKDVPKQAAKELHVLESEDRSNKDLSFGYCQEVVGRERTTEEKEYGMAMFAKDVYSLAVSHGQVPEKLKKSFEIGQKVFEDAVEKGFATKAAASGGMVAGIDSDGGVMIPPEFSTMLLEMGAKISFVRPRATAIPLGSDSIELPQFKDYDHSSNTIYGGARAYFKAENAAGTASKPTMEEVKLSLNALFALAYASNKLLTFSPQTASFLMQSLAEAIAWKEDDVFLTGTGSGMPLGVIGHNGTTTIAIETGQTLAATAVVTENILKMFQAHKVRNVRNTAWAYNKVDMFMWLALLTVDVGTGGAPVGLVREIQGSPQMNMLGLPLVDNEHCKALGTVGDIVLGDWSEYLVADDRRGPQLARSMHLQFDTGQEAFRIIKYVDGQPRYSQEFTRQNSTNTCSPFVELAARS